MPALSVSDSSSPWLIQLPLEPGLAQGKGTIRGRGASRRGGRILWLQGKEAGQVTQLLPLRGVPREGWWGLAEGGRWHPRNPPSTPAFRLHLGAGSESTQSPALRSLPETVVGKSHRAARADTQASAGGQGQRPTDSPLRCPDGAPAPASFWQNGVARKSPSVSSFCSHVCPFGLSPIMGLPLLNISLLSPLPPLGKQPQGWGRAV